MLYFYRIGNVVWEVEMLAVKHFILSVNCSYMEKDPCSLPHFIEQ